MRMCRHLLVIVEVLGKPENVGFITIVRELVGGTSEVVVDQTYIREDLEWGHWCGDGGCVLIWHSLKYSMALMEKKQDGHMAHGTALQLNSLIECVLVGHVQKDDVISYGCSGR